MSLVCAPFVGRTQMKNDFLVDSSFFRYMRGINSAISFEAKNLCKEEFVIFNSQNYNSRQVVTWVSFDSTYVISITQNIFSTEEVKTAESYNLVVYSKIEKKLFLFNHINEENISCRSYFSLSELIPYLRQCYVFDQNYKCLGLLYFQFNLIDNKCSFAYIKEHKGERLMLEKQIGGLENYNHNIYRLLFYDDFKIFIDKILFIATDFPTKNLNWHTENEIFPYERIIMDLVKK